MYAYWTCRRELHRTNSLPTTGLELPFKLTVSSSGSRGTAMDNPSIPRIGVNRGSYHGWKPLFKKVCITKVHPAKSILGKPRKAPTRVTTHRSALWSSEPTRSTPLPPPSRTPFQSLNSAPDTAGLKTDPPTPPLYRRNLREIVHNASQRVARSVVLSSRVPHWARNSWFKFKIGGLAVKLIIVLMRLIIP